ncbi:MAG: HupE/UreJ family protein [Hyphomicrobiales bacterium]
MSKTAKFALTLTGMTLYTAPVLAHPGHGRPENPIHGLLHPFSDIDHLLAAASVVIVALAVIVVGCALLWRAVGWKRTTRRAD